MTVTEICLVVIAGVLALKGLVGIVLLVKLWGSYKRQVLPLLRKADGVLDTVAAVAESAREQVEEVRSVVEDISYRTRLVAAQVQERVVPSLSSAAGVVGGIAQVLGFFLGRKK